MTLNTQEKRRLAAHFGFKKMPFPKYVRSKAMYNSKAGRSIP